jgi:hypothetical protein
MRTIGRSGQTKNKQSFIPVSPWPQSPNSRITRLHVREAWGVSFNQPCFITRIKIRFWFHHVAACSLSLSLSLSRSLPPPATHFSVSTSRSIFTKFRINIMPYEATLMPCFVTTLRIHWRVASGTVVRLLLGPRMAFCNGRYTSGWYYCNIFVECKVTKLWPCESFSSSFSFDNERLEFRIWSYVLL